MRLYVLTMGTQDNHCFCIYQQARHAILKCTIGRKGLKRVQIRTWKQLRKDSGLGMTVTVAILVKGLLRAQSLRRQVQRMNPPSIQFSLGPLH